MFCCVTLNKENSVIVSNCRITLASCEKVLHHHCFRFSHVPSSTFTAELAPRGDVWVPAALRPPDAELKASTKKSLLLRALVFAGLVKSGCFLRLWDICVTPSQLPSKAPVCVVMTNMSFVLLTHTEPEETQINTLA